MGGRVPTGLKVGQLVLSKMGRDQGRAFLVLKVDDEGFAYLTDGELRRVAKPKRKNVKHLQPTNRIAVEMMAKVEAGKKPTDAEVRKTLVALGGGKGLPDPRGEEEVDGQKGCN